MSVVVGAVVLGRLGSRRLPGKVLREFGGAPLLAHVLGRLERCAEVDRIVVATSEDPADEAIAEWCASQRVDVYRGPVDDVMARMIGAAERCGFDAVARINGDSPWLDPELLDHAIRLFREHRPDLVTNLLERDWPYGISTEILDFETLRTLWGVATTSEREHVTARMYAEPDRFDILNIPSEHDVGVELRLTVDSQEDADRFNALLGALGPSARQASTADVIATARACGILHRETS